MKDKRSFFERLTGTVNPKEDEVEDVRVERRLPVKGADRRKSVPVIEESIPEEGELTADVYQTPDDIIIKTIVAGVRPEDLDISITRDMITIRGSRQESSEVNDGDYFHKELYWGTFSRTILLPQEIDVDASEASEKHGLLMLRLPKMDKSRQTKLKVRSS
ncbi:MAG: Protein containing Heat shock protein Hsp20 protein [Parcubacteria group bacterium GW2011_GWA2_49_9]|nr:MAG: Protein containing Heat shock protein Hsp20 protein [Parcubacteria group bacterium GW2011_GWA2_49_9]